MKVLRPYRLDQTGHLILLQLPSNLSTWIIAYASYEGAVLEQIAKVCGTQWSHRNPSLVLFHKLYSTPVQTNLLLSCLILDDNIEQTLCKFVARNCHTETLCLCRFRSCVALLCKRTCSSPVS